MRCFKNRSTISGFVLPCRQLILCRFLGFLGIHYHQLQCRQKAKTDEAYQISLNCFTGQAKKMVYVFHTNGNSFDMIFITIIQPKIHKSNGFLKCFHRVFILICFSLQSSHTIFNIKKYIQRQLHIFFSRFLHIDIFQKQSSVP